MVRLFNEQGLWVPDGCSVRYFNSVVRDIIVKQVKNKLRYRKWGELYSLDYHRILDKVNDELDKWFDWK